MLRGLLHAMVLLGVFMAPVGAALFRVWVHNDAVQSGYLLSAAERQRVELRRLKRQLEVELAAEKSPEHLGRLAMKLGLGPVPAGLAAAPAKAPAKTPAKVVAKARAEKGKSR